MAAKPDRRPRSPRLPEEAEAAAEVPAHRNGAPTWLASAVDAYALAQDALASGQEEKAFAIMRAESRAGSAPGGAASGA